MTAPWRTVGFETSFTVQYNTLLYLASAQDRFWRRAIKLWTDVHTLPGTNPLRNLISRIRKFRPFHRSPLRQVADFLKDVSLGNLEIISPFTLAPWERRIQISVDNDITLPTHADAAVLVAVSSSARNGLVGIGGATETKTSSHTDPVVATLSSTLDTRVDRPESVFGRADSNRDCLKSATKA